MSKAKYNVEGRPPYFDGTNYYFWKNKMQLFMKSQDIGMWRIITDGYFIASINQNDSTSAEKKEIDWTPEDKTKHEGTSHVKETRLYIGIWKFGLFEMNEGETIDEMYSRFITIVNEMRSLDKPYSVPDIVRMIMRCLP
ncbi:uncharacterized protein [Cicer arietinum]|uniref:uncharacterized protein n=1 Tax=Cicer arietinum TaxID=3827 RepID=UPI003CC54A2C